MPISEATRLKMVEASKKRWSDPEQHKKTSIAVKKAMTPEICRIISEKAKGRTIPEETREKISKSVKKTFEDPIIRQKFSDTLKKRWETPGYREKQSERFKLLWKNSQYRQKMTESVLGEKNPFYGKHLSEEARTKLSKAKKGMKISHETRLKLSKAHKGRKMVSAIFHHTKYKEIHGVDEGVFISFNEHHALHRRLRRMGKCNIPPQKLEEISREARKRRLRHDPVKILISL